MLDNKPNNSTLVLPNHHPRILDVIDHLVSPENHDSVPAGAQTLGMDLATTIVASGTTIFMFNKLFTCSWSFPFYLNALI
jgi:hypothetical protein